MQKDTQKDILVSVIIPIYNAGEWLERCLSSLAAQTLHEVEFICVLDCPTDGSELLAENYALRDSRFKILRNSFNQGQSGSRNAGIEAASGKYIGFVDHDDWCEHDMFEKLYMHAMQAMADVVFSDTFVERNSGTEIFGFENNISSYALVLSIVTPASSALCKGKLARSVWHSIYRNSFLKEKNIRFSERKQFFEEDALFNFEVFTQTSSFSYHAMPYYHWNLRRVEDNSNYNKTNILDSYTNYLNRIDKLLGSSLFSKSERRSVIQIMLSMQFYLEFNLHRNLKLKQLVDLYGKHIMLLSLKPLFMLSDTESKLQFALTNYLYLCKYSLFVLKLKTCYVRKSIS